MTTEQAQSGEPVKAKRPRIQPKPSIPAIIDEQEFKKNKSTDNARHVISAIEPITIDLHFDKHYLDRVQHGDDDGTKREGIEPESIQALVLKSIKHLVFYSCHLSSFTFVNMKNSIGTSNNMIRVALSERANGVT